MVVSSPYNHPEHTYTHTYTVHLSGCMEIAIISANSRDKSVLPYSCEPQLPACRHDQPPANTHIQIVHLDIQKSQY